MRARLTVLAVLLAVAVAGCGGSGDDPAPAGAKGAAARGEVQRFRSAPALKPPAVTVRRRSARTAPGYVFVTPNKGRGRHGPMIIDNRGDLVWFRRAPRDGFATDLKVQRYRGRPVLTWWQGRSAGGGGNGEYVIADTSYREIARGRRRRGRPARVHALA